MNDKASLQELALVCRTHDLMQRVRGNERARDARLREFFERHDSSRGCEAEMRLTDIGPTPDPQPGRLSDV